MLLGMQQLTPFPKRAGDIERKDDDEAPQLPSQAEECEQRKIMSLACPPKRTVKNVIYPLLDTSESGTNPSRH